MVVRKKTFYDCSSFGTVCLSTGLQCSLKRSLSRRFVSSMYCLWQRLQCCQAQKIEPYSNSCNRLLLTCSRKIKYERPQKLKFREKRGGNVPVIVQSYGSLLLLLLVKAGGS